MKGSPINEINFYSIFCVKRTKRLMSFPNKFFQKSLNLTDI